MEFAFLPRIRPLIYLLLITCITFTLYWFSPYSQRYWLLWATLTLALISLNETFWKQLFLILLTGLIAASVVFLATFISPYVIAAAFYLMLVTGFAIYLSQCYPAYFLPAFIINVFAVLAICLPMPLAGSLERSAFILVSTLIVMVCQAVYWPQYLRYQMSVFLSAGIDALMRLTDDIFSCFLHPDYTENRYLYERRVHHQKNQFMRCIEKLRKLNLRSKKPASNTIKYFLMMNRMVDTLYGNLLDIAALRWRVTDPTVFGVCTDELNAILLEMKKLFCQLKIMAEGKKLKINTTALLEKINHFEENYQNVLQVTAPDPLVFLLFIDSLKSFALTMRKMNGPSRGGLT